MGASHRFLYVHINATLALVLSLIVYESVDIIGGSYSQYFILFIVYRLSPIGPRLSQLRSPDYV